MGECFVQTLGGKSEAKYGWSKAPYTISQSETPGGSAIDETLYYSDTYELDVTGYFRLFDYQMILPKDNVGSTVLDGKYILPAYDFDTNTGLSKGVDGRLLKGAGAICEFDILGSSAWGVKAYSITRKNYAIEACVINDNANAYPDDGYKDGYKYVKVVS